VDRVALICGPPGSGKRRLVAELGARIGAHRLEIGMFEGEPPADQRQRADCEVRLGPLRGDAAAKIVEQVAPGAAPAAHARVLALAGGLPGALIALARAARHGGLLADPPDVLVAPIAKALEALSADVRAIVRAASVLPVPFDAAAVTDVAGSDAGGRTALAALRGTDWLEQVDGDRLRFRDDLTRLCIRATLMPADRLLASRRAAEHLERGGAEVDPASLAELWEDGGAPGRALLSWARAAHAALAAGRADEAVAHAERALACAPPAPARGDLLLVQAEASLASGHAEQAAALASEAAALLPPGTPRAMIAQRLAGTRPPG
jgi:hypothetical protein